MERNVIILIVLSRSSFNWWWFRILGWKLCWKLWPIWYSWLGERWRLIKCGICSFLDLNQILSTIFYLDGICPNTRWSTSKKFLMRYVVNWGSTTKNYVNGKFFIITSSYHIISYQKYEQLNGQIDSLWYEPHLKLKFHLEWGELCTMPGVGIEGEVTRRGTTAVLLDKHSFSVTPRICFQMLCGMHE